MNFEVTPEDLIFYDTISPVINGVKHPIPALTLCPRERQRRRSAYRNFSNLYQRRCEKSGKTIISMYREDQPFPVHHPDVRHEYRMQKRFSRELQKVVCGECQCIMDSAHNEIDGGRVLCESCYRGKLY